MSKLSSPVTEPGNCHRIAVAVEDLQRSTQWFQDVLGATLLPVAQQAGGAVETEQDGGSLTILWLQNVPIVILEASDPDGPIGRYFARNGASVHSLAWEIPDMWLTENLLRAAGVRIVGTDIPGRHFFMHPRDTHGLLLEYTDDKLPGDPRLGAPDPKGAGQVPVLAVVRVNVVVHDLDDVVECLRYTFNGQVVDPPLTADPAAPAGSPDTAHTAHTSDKVVDVRIGDMTLRLVVPTSDDSRYAHSVSAGDGRFHSLTLAVDDFAHLDEHLAAAGIQMLSNDGTSVWTDPRHTQGLRLELIDADTLASR